MHILFNALGIRDSGGVAAFNKSLKECSSDAENSYFIVCNKGVNINALINKYKDIENFRFNSIKNNGIFYRIYYENFIFRKIVTKQRIELIYNFSGSSQKFLKTNKLIKIQNLLFYSKRLDWFYIKNHRIIPWLKQIFFKRLFFKFMVSKEEHFEIQSSHVKDCLSDFINTTGKSFYIKSDVSVSKYDFYQPKNYDFSKKVKFLYIVGPHFELMHKNFSEFVSVMSELNRCDVDFEIDITLTKDQLESFKGWDTSLNLKTNFFGYICEQEKMSKLFCDNTILISTSVIETLGLHVIEGIKNGVIVIVPHENYADAVYGRSVLTYELFSKTSLFEIIMSTIGNVSRCDDKILSIQEDLRNSELGKFNNILSVFNKVKKC